MSSFPWETAKQETIRYCEKHGVYEIWSQKGNRITYYSWFPDDPNHPFIKVVADVKKDKEISRKRMRYTKCPKFLKGENGTRYNYCCG